jgi:maltooligosyltrehalose trehalohydrolase
MSPSRSAPSGPAANDLRVWAPLVDAIALDAGGSRSPMVADGDGWFSAPWPPPGTDYWLVIDGDRIPDPRSRSQPFGYDGPSRVVDDSTYEWHDHAWHGFHLPAAVLYEMHVGTFSASGTFAGAIAHLDHLVALGVDAVEIMPLATFPGRWGWGYDGVLLFAPQEAYGGVVGAKAFVDACHARGLGVLVDVVFNHFGPAGNHLGRLAPYVAGAATTPWGQAVNLDGPGSDEVRNFFLDNSIMWLRDYHADGLRLDAVHAYEDHSAVHFLEELSNEVDRLAAHLGRPLWLVTESDLNNPRLVTAREANGYGCHASWSDDFHHALHVAITGERGGYYADFDGVDHVARSLTRGYVYEGQFSPSRRRRHGRPMRHLPATRLLGYLQNHDQVGNRALGDRIGTTASVRRQLLGATVVLMAPFVPMLFAGEEWAASTPFAYFSDHDDPELAEAITNGRRSEFAAFGWAPQDVADPQAPETFARSVLRWDERDDGEHAAALAWYRTLIAIRKKLAALADDDFDHVGAIANDDLLLMQRGAITVAVNFGDEPRTVALAGGGVLAAVGDVTTTDAGMIVGGESAAVLWR